MEDDDSDSDAEMADYGTDFSDDVDPNFDQCQGTSTLSHWQVPTSATSNLAQSESREADGSSMIPLSDPE